MQDAFPHTKPEQLDADDKVIFPKSGNSKEAQKLMAEDAKYWKAADKDGDNRLNRVELAAFLTPVNTHRNTVLRIPYPLRRKTSRTCTAC